MEVSIHGRRLGASHKVLHVYVSGDPDKASGRFWCAHLPDEETETQRGSTSWMAWIYFNEGQIPEPGHLNRRML